MWRILAAVVLGSAIGAFAGGRTVLRFEQRRIAELAGDLATARDRTGTACAPVYGVWWEERKCDGLAGVLPKFLQKLVCPRQIRLWRGPRLADITARVAVAGPAQSPTLVLEERGTTERVLDVTWSPSIRK